MPKQQTIPGTIDPKDEVIHEQALRLVELYGARKVLAQDIDHVRQSLLDAMAQAGRKTYRHGELAVVIDRKPLPVVTLIEE